MISKTNNVDLMLTVLGDDELTYPQLLTACVRQRMARAAFGPTLALLLTEHCIERVSQAGCVSIYRCT